MNARRHCLMLDLRDDAALIAQYEDWHRRVPSAVLAHLRHHGVLAMQIFRLGTRLVMVMDVDAGRFDPAAMTAAEATDPELQAWEALMWHFQSPTPWTLTGQKWTPAERIFELEWPAGAPLRS